jgi:phenol hydroxylase P0 protein
VSEDPLQKYVRVTGIRNKKFVEFDFSMGDPTIFVELILPHKAFEEFCAHNNVKELTAEQAIAVDYDKLKWRNGVPGKPGQ